MTIRYLHTMVRVKDLEKSIAFYKLLGLEETRRYDNEGGRFTLVFMAPPGQPECPVELTYNWDGDPGLPSDGRHFGHLAYEVDDIYATCAHLQAKRGADQPPAAGWADGVCAVARQRVGGVAAEGRGAGPGGALGEHGNTGHW
jgi:lactoylglutathione lyase